LFGARVSRPESAPLDCYALLGDATEFRSPHREFRPVALNHAFPVDGEAMEL